MARKSRRINSTERTYENKDSLFSYYRAGIYTRLSVEDDVDIEQNSIANQRKLANSYLADKSNIQIVDYYSDYGYTGMNYERPEFQRLLKDIQSGRINCIVVKDISRLGRHFVMTAELVEQTLPNMGIRLICINDQYDSANPQADTSALSMPLKMIMNDYYAKDISKKIRSSISAKIEGETFLPSSIPYGYLRNSKTISFDIDTETSPIVQKIFEMRSQGESFTGIARELNRMQIPSPGKLRFQRGLIKTNENAMWDRKTISKIVSNPVYLGHRIHGSKVSVSMHGKKIRTPKDEWKIIKNAHSPIIQQDLFDRVQRINKEQMDKQKEYRTRPDVKVDYRNLLRGKVFCADCGNQMIPTKGAARLGSKTGSRVYYDCGLYRRSQHLKCSSRCIRQEKIITEVINLLNQQVRLAVDDEIFMNELRIQQNAKNENDNRQLQKITTKEKAIEAKLERLLEDLTVQLINREEYSYMREHYKQQLKAIQNEKAEIVTGLEETEKHLQKIESWLTSIREYGELQQITQPLMDALILRIIVTRDKNIRIILNCQDPFLV